MERLCLAMNTMMCDQHLSIPSFHQGNAGKRIEEQISQDIFSSPPSSRVWQLAEPSGLLSFFYHCFDNQVTRCFRPFLEDLRCSRIHFSMCCCSNALFTGLAGRSNQIEGVCISDSPKVACRYPQESHVVH